MKSIIDAIKEYRGGKDCRGNLRDGEWEIFWNYKCEVEGKDEDIFDDKHIDQTTLLLSGYLLFMGMGNSLLRKKGVKPEDRLKHPEEFKQVLLDTRDSIRKLSELKFSDIPEDDKEVKEVVMNCFKQLQEKLAEKGASNTDTMITKILMACWGETPGYDSHFRDTYNELFNPKPKLTIRSTSETYFESLLKLKRTYEGSWKGELKSLEREDKKRKRKKYTLTEKGNPIPHARLIDMGFWGIGNELITIDDGIKEIKKSSKISEK